MILSLKPLKSKLILLVAVVIAAAAVFAVLLGSDKTAESKNTSGTLSDRVGAVDYSAATEEERLRFISQFGYTVDNEPVSSSEVVIPEEFDVVYNEYNALQKKQGLDLERYRGITVKKWTYTVTNYPGYESADCIRITLLVYNGKVIGGDVCSVELDGFMTTFGG